MSKLSVWKLPLAVIAVAWAWQALAYSLFIPKSGLSYGWFKTPPGHTAGLLVLDVPVYAVLVAMCADAAIGSFRIWKEGRRGRIAGLWLWCLGLYVVFYVPSLLIDFQGNASIFI